ncbi:MAG: DinB family protein [Lutibacter sp.]|nr:DinB family protein [Lutibacter sp.]MBP9601239.1 DinB family protein [Lutibacter sp.]
MTAIQVNENEYAPFYKIYIEAVGIVNLFDVLESSLYELLKTVDNLSEEALNYQYEDDKWTIKDILQHLIDTERIMCYRALRFSRNDATELPGYDESWYVDHSNGNDRNLVDLLNELKLVRLSSIALFKSFTEEMFTLSGIANDADITVRALCFIIPGHQLHHLKIIKERYL